MLDFTVLCAIKVTDIVKIYCSDLAVNQATTVSPMSMYCLEILKSKFYVRFLFPKCLSCASVL
jgi:hypothetical protein